MPRLQKLSKVILKKEIFYPDAVDILQYLKQQNKAEIIIDLADAKANEVAIETLDISPEGLEKRASIK